MLKFRLCTLSGILAVLTLLPACGQGVDLPENDGRLRVVATTTIVGDVVSQVGGELVELSVLLPSGTDPHSFDPTPQDVARVAEADLVFANGAGLEEFLANLIESAGVEDRVVHVSEGVDFLITDDSGLEVDSSEEDHPAQGLDPHTWTDPNNVVVWVENIQRVLSEADPGNRETYAANADEYGSQLENLDIWIRERVSEVPENNRKLVSDHAIFGYFANEYGFEQVGALIPGYSTLSEPSAQDIARIEDAIAELDVNAVFVGNTINPSLAARVAEDTGTQLVFVYTGSLSERGGEAGTYLDYTRFNISAFVDALRE